MRSLEKIILLTFTAEMGTDLLHFAGSICVLGPSILEQPYPALSPFITSQRIVFLGIRIHYDRPV